MFVDTLPVGPFQTNCYLITCAETRAALLVDPGWNSPTISEAIAARRADVRLIVNTHAHWDHIGGNARFVQETGAPLALHHGDLPLLRRKGGAEAWGVPLPPSPEPDRLLNPGDVLEIGRLRFEVLFTPGHSPGHISLYEAAHRALFCGDVLFQRGIGRTDLPGGDAAALFRSIRDVLFALPDDVTVYPGHGPATTIGEERVGNPWVSI
ncbi:MAG: MBL fold metallo-hydrolase [Chloroflexi bacterium]|nr:MBL fold metallo-hydrolase [Chloroflexota bacterium]